jgi:hypothetical protein
LFFRIEDLSEAHFPDHLEAELIGDGFEVCLEGDFLLARALKFRGEDGPARSDIGPYLSLDVASEASHQFSQFLAAFPGDFWGGLEGIDEDLGGVLEVDLEEVGEEGDPLAAVQVVALVAGREVADRAQAH